MISRPFGDTIHQRYDFEILYKNVDVEPNGFFIDATHTIHSKSSSHNQHTNNNQLVFVLFPFVTYSPALQVNSVTYSAFDQNVHQSFHPRRGRLARFFAHHHGSCMSTTLVKSSSNGGEEPYILIFRGVLKGKSADKLCTVRWTQGPTRGLLLGWLGQVRNNPSLLRCFLETHVFFYFFFVFLSLLLIFPCVVQHRRLQ